MMHRCMRPHLILRRQLQSSDPNQSNSLIGAGTPIPKRIKHSLTYLLQRHPRWNGHLNNLTNSDGSPTKLPAPVPEGYVEYGMLLPIRIRESTFRGELILLPGLRGFGYGVHLTYLTCIRKDLPGVCGSSLSLGIALSSLGPCHLVMVTCRPSRAST
jgi:hypothetical protein